MSRTPLTWDRLPLFAADDEIGEAVLGRDRKREFAGIAQLHERDGMPKIDPVWGGRYVLGVKAFFDSQYGLSAAVPLAANGVEGDFHAQAKRAPKESGPQVAKTKDRPSGPVLVRRQESGRRWLSSEVG
jgi:hypothetical protein